jgi:ABC-type enterobactin transport system permease subunit
MTTTTRRFVRYIALPAVSAAILGGAALGLAGMANAGTYSYQPTPRPGIVATPTVKAQPPVLVRPGAQWHRHHGGGFVIDLPSGE